MKKLKLNIQLFADAEVSIKFDNKVTGEGKLKKYAATLQTINSVLSGLNAGATKDLEDGAKTTSEMSKDISKIGKNVGIAFNYGLISRAVSGIKKLGAGFTSLAKQSFDYLENFNLFQVAFNGNYNSAERFINKMTEMYGLDESWLTQTVGKFKQLSNAMGITAETGEKVSKLLTQMSLDISSLYNVDIDRAAATLSSAMAGQTKPIRGVAGGDITQATLQTTLDQLGIDNTVNKLSFAEKRLLIIISLTRQLNASIGDMGRTIESPSNQLRIMNEQWERLTRAVGNVFLPILSQILPYLNAILMVLTEIISSFATFLGFSMGDYDFFENTTSQVENLDTGLKSAGASAKKLKQGLRGFDKLNVITTPSSGGSGGGAGGVGGIGGIDNKLLDAFNKAYEEYQKKLGNVQMKATKIRDAIMDWLGFTKEIDPLTGKVYFKYQGLRTTLRNMWESFKKLSTTGKILVSLGIVAFFTNLYRIAKKLISVLGKTGLGKVLISLVSPVKGLIGYVKTYKSLSGSLLNGIKSGTNAWAKQLSVLDRLKITLLGAAGIYVGLKLVDKGLDDISKQGKITTKSFLELAAGIGTATASGALLGSQFGTWGIVIGGVTGAVIALYKALANYPNEVSRTLDSIKKVVDESNEYVASLKEQYNAIKENTAQQTAIQDAYSSLVSELENIVDVNGKVKKGYEERANFIVTTLNQAYGTEFKIVNGKIKNYKKELQSIKDIIAEKKKQIVLESAEESYRIALENQTKTYKTLQTLREAYNEALDAQKTTQEKLNKAQEDYNKITSGEWGTYGTQTILEYKNKLEDARKELENVNNAVTAAKDAVNNATEAYDSNTEAILNYEGLLVADTKKDAKLIEKYINQITSSYNDGKKNIKLTYDEQKNNALQYYTSVLRTTKENEGKITNEVLTNAESKLNSLKTNLTDMTNSVKGKMGDSLIEAWGTLASTSEKEFSKQFAKLPQDVQKEVVDKMYKKGYKISEELQKGIQAENPKVTVKTEIEQPKNKIKVDVDTSKAKESTSAFWNKLGNAFKKTFNMTIDALHFANGGLPPVGQLFVANEKGPELVGQIGGQSFVANQNQVVDLLDRKLGEAKANPINATFVIQVGDKEIAKQVINDLQDMAKTNGKPIKIGG